MLHPHDPFQEQPMISHLIFVSWPLLTHTGILYTLGSVFLSIFLGNISVQLDELSDVQISAYGLKIYEVHKNHPGKLLKLNNPLIHPKHIENNFLQWKLKSSFPDNFD